MTSVFPCKPVERSDRRVCRASLRLGGGAPRYRSVFLIEEALRLVSLPGENEGRIYFFRRLEPPPLPASAVRALWIECFQAAVERLAARAVHGTDSRAPWADAVFFDNPQQGLELFLRRVVGRGATAEWFWPLVADFPGDASHSQRFVAAIQQLRRLPASWKAVALALFHAIEYSDVEQVLGLAPPTYAREWLRELGDENDSAAGLRSVPLSPIARESVLRALRVLGPADSRTLWLAALAVIEVLPADAETGRASARARVTVQSLARVLETGPEQPARLELSPVSFLEQPAKDLDLPSAESIRRTIPRDAASVGSPPRAEAGAEPFGPKAPRDTRPAHGAPGEKALTGAGGILFLLNALQGLGFPAALRSALAERDPGFPFRVLLQLTLFAGMTEADPVVLWFQERILRSGSDSLESMPAPMELDLASNRLAWPRNLRPFRSTKMSLPRLASVWSVATRRFCWREAGITAFEVIRRPAIFRATSTEIDITLPLASADLRIRRPGLDIDPAWLPWFGFVVRFHYVKWLRDASE